MSHHHLHGKKSHVSIKNIFHLFLQKNNNNNNNNNNPSLYFLSSPPSLSLSLSLFESKNKKALGILESRH